MQDKNIFYADLIKPLPPEELEKESKKKEYVKRVLCFQPMYASGKPASHKAFWSLPSYTTPLSLTQGKLDLISFGGSLLAKCFNDAWVTALNMYEAGEVTHFFMMHDDVVCQRATVDILMEELVTHDADICSVVIPIKDGLGVTSTAIEDPQDDWVVYRRLTMQEVYRLPPTFTAADCGYPDKLLLANTGCWLADLRNPIFRQTNLDGELLIYFNIKDRIVRDKQTGKWQGNVYSEDWNFSRMVGRLGGKVVCTRRVDVTHIGDIPFNNREPWGDWEHDKATTVKHNGEKITNKRPTSKEDPVLDVDGWMSPTEGSTLSKITKGMEVIEIGSYLGRSTVYIAREAKKVYAIDTFDGRATAVPKLCRYTFQANLERYGVADKVEVLEGTSEEMIPLCGEVDAVFIDGDHKYDAVKKDIELALTKLRPEGVLIFHDYDSDKDPDVTKAVNEFINSGRGKLMGRVHALAVVTIDRNFDPDKEIYKAAVDRKNIEPEEPPMSEITYLDTESLLQTIGAS